MRLAESRRGQARERLPLLERELTTVRVLYICNEYPPAIHGGIGVFVRTLAEHLAFAGHEIAVLGFAGHVRQSTDTTENGVRVVRLPWPRNGAGLRAGRLGRGSAALASRRMLSREAARFAARFRPDVVESHDWSGPLWSPPWRPTIVRLHGAASVSVRSMSKKAGRLLRFFERRNLLIANAVISPSHFAGRTTLEALRVRPKCFEVLYHGIDADFFQPHASLRDPNEILFAGTVKKEKGILELFEAIPRILDQCPEACFTIAGRYPEDPSHPCSPRRLSQILTRTGLSSAERVRFLGQVTRADLPGVYSRAAVAVFPSHGEAFGIGCAEAMACGAAVVMTARGSGPELVEHGKSGLLVEPADVRGLAELVVGLLKNPALRHSLGAAARRRVLEKFDLRDAATSNIRFYEQVVSRFHAARHRHA
jgi:glycosyltransferase involved in cell wall biosynthesis